MMKTLFALMTVLFAATAWPSPGRASGTPEPGAWQSRQTIEFSLRDLDNKAVTSADVLGKVTVLLFVGRGLPMTREAVQQMQRVADRHPSANVFIVVTNGTNAKDSSFASDDDLRAFVQTGKIRLPVLRDPNGEGLFKKLGLRVLPSLVILNRKGELAAAAREGFDPNVSLPAQLSREIEQPE